MRAGEIGAQHRVPIFELHAQRERVARDGGVVDQDVERAEFREQLLEAGFHLRGVGHIHRHGERLAARGFDFRDERRKLFRVARGDGDFRAGFGERQRSGAPDSLRRTCNESDFIFERKHRMRTYRISNVRAQLLVQVGD